MNLINQKKKYTIIHYGIFDPNKALQKGSFNEFFTSSVGNYAEKLLHLMFEK